MCTNFKEDKMSNANFEYEVSEPNPKKKIKQFLFSRLLGTILSKILLA